RQLLQGSMLDARRRRAYRHNLQIYIGVGFLNIAVFSISWLLNPIFIVYKGANYRLFDSTPHWSSDHP
ncbi:hypothetical protein, partial [Pseudomonas maioricensis]|uniref:hypothetical protein n=1 Tax=Pseudomonas maioricensis TaxID=1766623 RepID=UPI001FAC7628